MVFNNNYPYNLIPQYQVQQQQVQQNNNGLIWVQGEAGAKGYLLNGPNQSVLLLDSENNVFYIKSTDASGMPIPLRIFDYTERVVVAKNATSQSADYVTRDEFEKRLAELSDGKRSVPAV